MERELGPAPHGSSWVTSTDGSWSPETTSRLEQSASERAQIVAFEATHLHACDVEAAEPARPGKRRVGRPERVIYVFQQWRPLRDVADCFGVAQTTIRRSIARGDELERVLLDAQDRYHRHSVRVLDSNPLGTG